MSSVNAPSL
jgi:hypothetical protein